MLIRNNQASRTLENGQFINRYDVYDTDATEFCWRHGKDGSYKLEQRVIINRDKTEKVVRICEKCHQIVEYTHQP